MHGKTYTYLELFKNIYNDLEIPTNCIERFRNIQKHVNIFCNISTHSEIFRTCVRNTQKYLEINKNI